MKQLRVGQLQDAKVLVRVPNWVGDAVMCLPALRELRKALPDAEMALVARPWVREIFPLDELRCRIIAYDTRTTHRGFLGRWRLAAELRKEKFAAAILFQNALDAALLALLAEIPIRAGYARHGRGPILTHPMAVPRKGEIPPHEAHYYLELLRRLGVIESFAKVREILLPTYEDQRATARTQLLALIGQARADQTEEKFVVGISPGATFGTAKRWPGEQFAELAEKLHRELGANCVFFGSKEEKPLVDSLLPKTGGGAVSLAGETSLSEFMRLVQGCDLYLTNDTGTMHVAAALGVPTLAIFGPTDERATRPLGPRVELMAGEAFCRPCLLRHCPIDHRCMTSIAVEKVFRRACSMLRNGRREARVDESGGVIIRY
ncbi:MAG: lipopolysaccharide heptosyltransferase II [Acidobacteria bacterium]|nr:lipopolysaccharide heptosyltransferase II [Acidobacteriota bacterium]